MKQNKLQLIRICLIIWVAFWIIPAKQVQAASVTMTFQTAEEVIGVGDLIALTVTLSSDGIMGDVEAYISYDDSMLRFVTAPACVRGNGGLLRVSDIGASPSTGERTYKLWFEAITFGECDISAYDRPKVYNYSDGSEMSVTAINTTIVILPSSNASDNSQLASLRLVDGKNKEVGLVPSFSGTETSYFAVVSNETQRVSVSALAQDENATVSLSGEQNLKLGSNVVQITVTAESGKKTVYTVYVERLEKPEIQEIPSPTPVPEEIMEIGDLSGISFLPSEEGVVLNLGHRFIVCSSTEGLRIPDGYERTYLFLNGIQATAYEKTDKTRQDTLLLVLKNESGVAAWYRYDREDQTVQRLSEEQFIYETVAPSEDNGLSQMLEQYKERQAGQLLVLAMLSGLCVVLLLVILILVLWGRRKR